MTRSLSFVFCKPSVRAACSIQNSGRSVRPDHGLREDSPHNPRPDAPIGTAQHSRIPSTSTFEATPSPSPSRSFVALCSFSGFSPVGMTYLALVLMQSSRAVITAPPSLPANVSSLLPGVMLDYGSYTLQAAALFTRYFVDNVARVLVMCELGSARKPRLKLGFESYGLLKPQAELSRTAQAELELGSA